MLALGLMTLFLSACSVAEDPAAALQLAQDSLHNGLTTEVSIVVPDGEATAQLRCTAEEQSLCFDSPQVLQGLTFTKSAAAVNISMEGLSETVQAGDLLKSSAANCLFEALEALGSAQAEELAVEEEFLLLEYESGELRMNWDGSLSSILCKNVEIIFDA